MGQIRKLGVGDANISIVFIITTSFSNSEYFGFGYMANTKTRRRKNFGVSNASILIVFHNSQFSDLGREQIRKLGIRRSWS